METLAGDFDYDELGRGYALQRRGDPRIAAQIEEALGSAGIILNVGAGAGSYEPAGRAVLAVEPSLTMLRQRPAGSAPTLQAIAEKLPLKDGAADAAMAIITIHQWRDVPSGLSEVSRVATGPIVVVAFDPEALQHFWLAEYAPELIAAEQRRDPPINLIREAIGRPSVVRPVRIPNDCTDGFMEAHYARPEQLLLPAVRRAQSGWAFVSPEDEERAVERLRADLESGEWDRKFGHLRNQGEYQGSLRLIVASGVEERRDAAT